MNAGICTGVENIGKLEEMGYDYLEWGVSQVTALSDQEFSKSAEIVQESRIRCEVCNLFFPQSIMVVGPDVNRDKVEEYIRKAFERLSRIGTEIVVVGSGRSRHIPEGWSREKGIEQFIDAMRAIGEEAARYNILATVEPLPVTSSNTINSLKEGMELVKAVNHPNVELMADFGHMRTGKEDLKIIAEASSMLKHLHIRNSVNGGYPLHKNEDDYAGFFHYLKEGGYRGRVSIEASTKDLDGEGPAALRLLKELSAGL